MAVLAVLMLTMVMVETLAKPVPGVSNNEIDSEQDTLHPEQQLHQNMGLDDFRQMQKKHMQHVGQKMQQVGHNQKSEDHEQNQNKQQDIEQVLDQQLEHHQEVKGFEQNQNEQYLKQLLQQRNVYNQLMKEYEPNINEIHNIEQDLQQHDKLNQEIKKYEPNINEFLHPQFRPDLEYEHSLQKFNELHVIPNYEKVGFEFPRLRFGFLRL
jgi:DNA repair exonuclease SbcCD ATPase subunit